MEADMCGAGGCLTWVIQLCGCWLAGGRRESFYSIIRGPPQQPQTLGFINRVIYWCRAKLGSKCSYFTVIKYLFTTCHSDNYLFHKNYGNIYLKNNQATSPPPGYWTVPPPPLTIRPEPEKTNCSSQGFHQEWENGGSKRGGGSRGPPTGEEKIVGYNGLFYRKCHQNMENIYYYFLPKISPWCCVCVWGGGGETGPTPGNPASHDCNI